MTTVHIIKEVSAIGDLPQILMSSDGSREYRVTAVMGSSNAGEAFLETVYALLGNREATRIAHLENISRELSITNPTESKLGKALLSKLMNRHPNPEDNSLKTLQQLTNNHLLIDLSELGILMLDDDNGINPRLPKRETLKNKINSLPQGRCLALACYTQI